MHNGEVMSIHLSAYFISECTQKIVMEFGISGSLNQIYGVNLILFSI
jgi:hypothetical protein